MSTGSDCAEVPATDMIDNRAKRSIVFIRVKLASNSFKGKKICLFRTHPVGLRFSAYSSPLTAQTGPLTKFLVPHCGYPEADIDENGINARSILL